MPSQDYDRWRVSYSVGELVIISIVLLGFFFFFCLTSNGGFLFLLVWKKCYISLNIGVLFYSKSGDL